MKLRYLLVVFTVLILTVFSKAPDIQASDIPSYPILLINVYHPQCHRCKQTHVEFNTLHQLSANRKYQVAEINCANQADFCDSLKTSYPKAYLYVEGQQIMYQGKITAKQLDEWLQSLIELDLPILTQDTLKQKQGKQSFLLVGGLNMTEKIQIAATKFARYIGIQFYQIESTQKVFSLYVTDAQKKIDLQFPLNNRLFAFELFHRTRDHIMSVNKPQYLEYFRKEKDFDSHLIIYDHHDQLSADANPFLDTICFQLAVDAACFSVQKESPYYKELVGNFRPYQNRTSIIFSKKNKLKAYTYPDQKFDQKTFKQFMRDSRGKTRIPDYDYIKQAHDKMKYQYVTKIDDQEHAQVIKNHTFVFVEYYSPFFDNCTSFVPAYDAVGEHFKQDQNKILIASLDADQELALADEQKVKDYPDFKLFIGGEGFHYRGERTTQSIIDFITSIVQTKIPKVSQATDMQKPAVGISGIDEESFLHALPFFYKDIPIYWITGESEFAVKLYKQNGQVQKFTQEEVKIKSISNWLYQQLGPVIVSLGDSNVPKKLQIAMKKKKPILGLINKNQQGPVDQELKVLTQFCQNKKDFVCGVANEGEDDYQQLVDWIHDNDQVSNRLVWIEAEKGKCFIYGQDLKSLTGEMLNEFIEGIKNGTIAEHKRPTRKSQSMSQQQQYQEEQQSEYQVMQKVQREEQEEGKEDNTVDQL